MKINYQKILFDYTDTTAQGKKCNAGVTPIIRLVGGRRKLRRELSQSKVRRKEISHLLLCCRIKNGHQRFLIILAVEEMLESKYSLRYI